MSLSQDIVRFIDHLHPLYINEKVDGEWCARSLTDGTLICPVKESLDDEIGYVNVRWQGDINRQTMVQGVSMASIAVARYVELHHLATSAKDTKNAMKRFSDHFTFKTGASLIFESHESNLAGIVAKAIGKVGEAAVIEVLKKQIGL